MATSENITHGKPGPLDSITALLAHTARHFEMTAAAARRHPEPTAEQIFVLDLAVREGTRLAQRCCSTVHHVKPHPGQLPQEPPEPLNAEKPLPGGGLTRRQAAFLARELSYRVGAALELIHDTAQKVAEFVHTEKQGVIIRELTRAAEEVLEDCIACMDRDCNAGRIRASDLRNFAVHFDRDASGQAGQSAGAAQS